MAAKSTQKFDKSMIQKNRDKEREQLSERLKNLGTEVLKDLEAKKNPELKLVQRSLNNVFFDSASGLIRMGDKEQKRYYFNINQAKKFMQTLLVAKQIKTLLDQNEPALSTRQLFYTMKHTIGNSNENTFDIQGESDPIIEDVETMVDALREQLSLIAVPKGVISGPLVVEDHKSGDTLDFTKMGSGGGTVPPIVEQEYFDFREVNADFVLVVEKFAVWNLLNQSKYWKSANCILLTGKGQPARAERRLLNRLANEAKLPVYVFADLDPWGYYIYSVYKQGSINLAFFSEKAGTPQARFLGFQTKDVKTFDMPKSSFIKLKDVDFKRITELKNYDWFNSKPWQQELANLKELGVKVESDALVTKSIKFTAEEYLPTKIEKKDFLP